jgi:hypothetical protein
VVPLRHFVEDTAVWFPAPLHGSVLHNFWLVNLRRVSISKQTPLVAHSTVVGRAEYGQTQAVMRDLDALGDYLMRPDNVVKIVLLQKRGGGVDAEHDRAPSSRVVCETGCLLGGVCEIESAQKESDGQR